MRTGLTRLQTYSVGLVDRSESDLLTDKVTSLDTFVATGTSRVLTGALPLNLLQGAPIGADRVVVNKGGEPLGAGSVNVFQKIFFRRLSLLNESTGKILFQETTPPPPLFALVADLANETKASPDGSLLEPPILGLATPSTESSASASSSGGSLALDHLISQGARLFLEETFKGNGRTCGTCHPVSNNFTIDADFIATLPSTDPLFVAEFNPALAQLERPQLMRAFGLILENLDGFSSPTTKFVMRGVPHTLGLQVSLTRDTSLTNPPRR